MVDRLIGVLALIIGVTALSVIVSKKSNTAKVLDSLLGGITDLQKAAVSPVTAK